MPSGCCARRAAADRGGPRGDQRRGADRSGWSRRRSASSCGGSSASVRGGGRWCCRSSWRSETVALDRPSPAASASSSAWRCSPLALIWLIALVTYEPTDPVVVLHAGAARRAGQLRRPGRRVRGRAVVPAARLRVVPRSRPARRRRLALFWCRRSTRSTRRSSGAALLFGCLTSLLHLAVGAVTRLGPAAPGGRLPRRVRCPSELADYLNRTGSIIVILTLLLLSIILATQFSFGRMFSGDRRRRVRVGAAGRSARCASGARRGAARRRGARSSRKRMAQSPEDVKADRREDASRRKRPGQAPQAAAARRPRRRRARGPPTTGDRPAPAAPGAPAISRRRRRRAASAGRCRRRPRYEAPDADRAQARGLHAAAARAARRAEAASARSTSAS